MKRSDGHGFVTDAETPYVASWGGTGEQVVLVHGDAPIGPLAWLSQRRLRDRYTLSVLTRAGYGQRSALRIDARRDADDLCAALSEPVHLIGHSHGAVVAALATAAAPDLVRSVTLIEPPLFQVAADEPEVQAVLREADALFGTVTAGPIPAGTLSALFGGQGADFATPEWSLLRTKVMESVLPWTYPIDFAGLRGRVSALVVCGAWSAAFTAVCERIARELSAPCVRIPGAGHSPHLVEVEFDQVLLRHLAAAGEPNPLPSADFARPI
ncbi:alpha/beta fold hydrolase [Nocardia sp. NPDC058658]|uniref:alpha/beta fold hydrolase n=1 Tax=Nocardia sp. NPDC058658 TaxID=3346580 RepID=UPI00365B78CE